MYSKAGVSKVLTIMPIKVRDSKDSVLVNSVVSLTVRLKDYTKLIIIDANKLKEKMSKYCTKGYLDVVKFISAISKEYDAEKVFLNIRFGYAYNSKIYPVSFDYEYSKNGQLRKSILNVVVQQVNESGIPVANGYVVDFKINFVKFVWYEDIIEAIESVLKECRGKPYGEVVKSLINSAVGAVSLSTNWYNMLIIQGNNVVVSERKLGGRKYGKKKSSTTND